MVVCVRVGRNKLPLTISLVFVAGKFPVCVRAPSLIDVYLPPFLQPFDAVSYAVRPFAASDNVEAHVTYFSNALRLCRVGNDRCREVLGAQDLRYSAVREFLLVYFVKDIQLFLLGVIVHLDESQRIDCKAKVQPAMQPVELCDHLIAHAQILYILEDGTAGPCDFPQILMLVALEILPLQLVRFQQELAA